MTEQLFSKVSEKLGDLPVAKVTGQVIDSVKAGNVTILTAETGSGKTLLASSKLADASDDQVVVLVPRRFLAMNAARTVADLGGLTLGKEVGFAVGRQVGSTSQFTPATKLVFATYGYALTSGLLSTAKTIVCDEVHEAGIDISLSRAILHRRLQKDPSLRVVEMSATLNAPRQASFWQDIAKTEIFHAEGRTYPCDVRHEPEKSIPVTVRNLLKNDGRKGIAVFRNGVGPVNQTAEDLAKLLRDSNITDVEIATIYRDMTDEQQQAALAPPAEGKRKVLIGTNVIESGMNIPWLDAGVSDGFTKIPYYRESGAEALVLEPLPSWRLIQQEGRIKRFCPGIFVLCSKQGFEGRPQENSPEISRISPKGLVMHAAGYNIDPTGLKFDAPVNPAFLERAKTELMRQQLLTPDWKLTDKGKFVHGLPLGAEAGSMLWQVPREILGDAVELAAVTEMQSLRADMREGHGFHDRSDTLDALLAFKKLGYKADEEKCLKHNVSLKNYEETRDLVKEIHARLGTDQGMNFRRANEHELVQLIMKGGLNDLFEMSDGKFRHVLTGRGGFEADKDTVAADSPERFAIASLREIPSRTGDPRVVVQRMTRITRDDLCRFAKENPEAFTNITFNRLPKGRDQFTGQYFGEKPITLGIPVNMPPAMHELIGPEYAEFLKQAPTLFPDAKPRGVGNTAAWEEQKRNTDRKRGDKK